MSNHDTTTTDPRDLLIAVVRRWLAEAAQWEVERAELVERAEHIEKPLRAATMRAERAEADLHALRRDVQSGSADAPSNAALKAKADEMERRWEAAKDALKAEAKDRREDEALCLEQVDRALICFGEVRDWNDDLLAACTQLADLAVAAKARTEADSPSRTALKAKANEYREALERERKVSEGLRAERDAMQHCADAHEERAALTEAALERESDDHTATKRNLAHATETQAAIRERLEEAVVALGGEGTRDIVGLAQRCLEGAKRLRPSLERTAALLGITDGSPSSEPLSVVALVVEGLARSLRPDLTAACEALGQSPREDVPLGEMAAMVRREVEAQARGLMDCWAMLPHGSDPYPLPAQVVSAIRIWISTRYGVDGYAETIKGLRWVNQQLNERLHAESKLQPPSDDVDAVLDVAAGGEGEGDKAHQPTSDETAMAAQADAGARERASKTCGECALRGGAVSPPGCVAEYRCERPTSGRAFVWGDTTACNHFRPRILDPSRGGRSAGRGQGHE